MRKPNKLNINDLVGIVAPSSPIDQQYLDDCVKALESLGYRVILGESTKSSYKGYLAGTDEIRAKDINDMFGNDEIKGIFCLRGGYGSCRIMDKIDWDLLKSNPKIFVGYSDITNIHMMINKKCDFISYHGPMVASNMRTKFDEYTKDSLIRTLDMNEDLFFQNPQGEELAVLVDGKSEGELVGGNLALIVASIGTEYEIDTKGKILFIEEVGENTYRVDRMLHQLVHSGLIQKSKGILIGDFTNCNQRNENEFTVMELFNDIIKPLNIPTLFNIKSGHDFPMATLPMGAFTTIDTGNKTIKFEVK